MASMYSLGLATSRHGLLCLGVPGASKSAIHKALLGEAARRYRSTYLSLPERPSTCRRLQPRQNPLSPNTGGCLQSSAPAICRRHISLYSDKKKDGFNKVITNYVEVPPTYTDLDGLPFNKKGDLSQAEIVKIFGSGLSAAKANKLLRILHGRRVAGTLGDPTLARNLAGYQQKQIDLALAYLRKTIAVDEVINAGLQAEDELARLEEEAERAAEEQGKVDEIPIEDQSLEDWQRKLARQKPKDDVYGVSVQEVIRARNKALIEAEERRIAEEKRLKEEEWAKLNPAGTKLATLPEQAREWTPAQQEKYLKSKSKLDEYTKRATSDITEPPEMGHWERFGSCIIATLAVVLVGAVCTAIYKPPPAQYRVWPDMSPSAATLAALIGTNVAVWALWRFPPMWRTLNRLFTLTAALPRPINLVCSAFSHQKLGHLASNMLFLWLIGTRVHDDVGRAAFLSMFFSIACLSGVGTSMIRVILLKDLTTVSLGSSGVGFGLMGAYLTMHRFDDMTIWGLPEYFIMPGLACLALAYVVCVMQMISSVRNPGGRLAKIDHFCHFTGLVAGTGYGAYYSSRSLGLENRRQATLENRRRARQGVSDADKAADISKTPVMEQARAEPKQEAK